MITYDRSNVFPQKYEVGDGTVCYVDSDWNCRVAQPEMEGEFRVFTPPQIGYLTKYEEEQLLQRLADFHPTAVDYRVVMGQWGETGPKAIFSVGPPQWWAYGTRDLEEIDRDWYTPSLWERLA